MTTSSLVTVPSVALRCPVLSARADGLRIDAVLEAHGLSAASFDARTPSVEIPLPRVIAIMDTLRNAGQPGWALRGSTRLERGVMGVLDHLCAAAPTIEACLADFVRYFGLVAHDASIELRRPDDELHLELAFAHAPPPMTVVFVESALGLLWSRLRTYSDEHELRPSRVELRCSSADSPALEWERASGITPAYGRPRDRLVVPDAVARLPLPGHDPALRSFLDDLAAAELPSNEASATTSTTTIEPPPTSWTERAATSLRAARPDAALGRIARELAVSERTLRRRLAEEGTSFSELRQQELRRRAQAMLLDERLSPAEVAFSLGFSEMSAFHRAFKRWTGLTPRQWQLDH